MAARGGRVVGGAVVVVADASPHRRREKSGKKCRPRARGGMGGMEDGGKTALLWGGLGGVVRSA